MNARKKLKKVRERPDASDYARISDKGFGALATWYRCNNDGSLNLVQSNSHFFVPIQDYVCTIINPFTPDNNVESNLPIELRIKIADLDSIKSFLIKYII